MRIAFVDNLAVGGGLSRFSYMLCKSLAEKDSTIQIDYFVHEANLKRTPELANLPSGITVKLLTSTKAPSLAQRISYRLMKPAGKNPNAEIEKRVTGYDVAYFPSAHMMEKPSLSVPIVGTVHDFNWKYFFGRQIFSSEFVVQMDKAIVDWIENTHTVSSSHDVIHEAKKLYPSLSRFPDVVHIAPVAFSRVVDEQQAATALKGLDITYPYLIFPGNFFPHKNHLNLFTGFSYLRQRPGFENLKLLLTGMGTEKIPYAVAEKRGIQLITKPGSHNDFDIRGLGYQPNAVVDALIAKAKLLVSPSVYEAICTPGMDAWQFGTPTAIADIPPFREHEQVWGIRSAFFDPMDPVNIANVLEGYLKNYDQAKADGEVSKQNISKYTWDKVAEGYLKVFNKAINNN